MQKAHQNINWENKPSTDTPINETNLNLMDRSIDTIDDRVVTFDTTKANQSDLLQGVRNVTFTAETGTFHVTYFNGTVIDIDTDIEKIAINFYYDSNPSSPHYQHLVLTLDDGTVEYIDMSALITQYEFTNTGRIAFTVGADGSISADIVGGSITDDKMQPNYLADITAQAQSGAQSAINASGFKLDAEAWAVGTRNGVAVPTTDPAYHNNSKYWSQQANVTSFRSLTDVDIDDSTLAEGQYMGYDSNSGMITNMDIPQADSTPVRLIIISEEGSSVTITTPAGDTVTPTHIQSGQWQADFFGASAYGTYQIDAVLGGDDAQVSVNVDDCKIYVIDDSHFHASIVVTYPAGATVSCVKTGEPTQYATSSPYTFVVHSLGEYTITGTRNGITEVQTVTITASEQVVNITLTILPDGSTITPTDDVQILLNCADIWDKSYTAISELIADDTSLLKVLTSDNAIDYLVRSTTFASAITADEDAMSIIGSYDYCADTLLGDSTWATAILGSAYKDSVANVSVPKMTSANTPSGVASESSSYSSGYVGWKALDRIDEGTTNTGWMTASNPTTAYMQYDFQKSFKPYGYEIRPYYDSGKCRTTEFKMQGSNDDTFTDISEVQTFPNGTTSATVKTFLGNVHTSIKKVRLLVTGSQDTYYGCNALQIYGRENGGVQSWLKAGGITDKTYTTLAEVLADTTTLSALIASHDAVDYLVTAKAFIDEIVADATAMSYIGLNNYCANTLLADADWSEAIHNSSYSNSVINVKAPIMTGYTTPSGEVFASGYAGSYYPWYAFAERTSNLECWATSGNQTNVGYIGYNFGRPVVITRVRWRNRNDNQANRPLQKGIVQGSNDGTTWVDIAEVASQSYAQYGETSATFANDTAYARYRLFAKEVYDTGGLNMQVVQFYGREDV